MICYHFPAESKIWSKVAKLDADELAKQRDEIVSAIRNHFTSNQDTDFFRFQSSNTAGSTTTTPNKKLMSSPASAASVLSSSTSNFSKKKFHQIQTSSKKFRVYCFKFANATVSNPQSDDESDADDSGSKAAAIFSSPADLHAVVSCVRELNTTISSRLSLIAVAVEKVATGVSKIHAALESKEREEIKNKLKASVEVASSAADLKTTMVRFVTSRLRTPFFLKCIKIFIFSHRLATGKVWIQRC